ncbi:MAG: hypothetical protein QW228_03540 [Candidatus Aenigmatarchaeota archaeon]
MSFYKNYELIEQILGDYFFTICSDVIYASIGGKFVAIGLGKQSENIKSKVKKSGGFYFEINKPEDLKILVEWLKIIERM